MNQTTVERVIGWLAEATGKDVACDRPALVELMNDIRQLAYSNRQVLEHAKRAFLCAPVQRFCSACGPGYCGCSGGAEGWSGVTLPSWMLQPTMIFHQGVSMPYVSRWASYSADPGSRSLYEFQDMGDDYVFERDPGCVEPFILELMALKCGPSQTVTVSYIDDQNKTVTEDPVLLKQGYWMPASRKVKSIMPSGVQMPLSLQGPIRVRASGVDVAQWEPGIDVPKFRRVRINSPCSEGSLAIEGIRRFGRLWGDRDVVEHDNRMAWVAGAHFVRTVDRSKMDQAEIANAMFKRNLFDSFIESEAASEQTGKRTRVPVHTSFNSLPDIPYYSRRR